MDNRSRIAIYGGSIHLAALQSALFVFSPLAKVAPYGRWSRRMVPPHKWTIGITIICYPNHCRYLGVNRAIAEVVTVKRCRNKYDLW
jgi:hypothetical protein